MLELLVEQGCIGLDHFELHCRFLWLFRPSSINDSRGSIGDIVICMFFENFDGINSSSFLQSNCNPFSTFLGVCRVQNYCYTFQNTLKIKYHWSDSSKKFDQWRDRNIVTWTILISLQLSIVMSGLMTPRSITFIIWCGSPFDIRFITAHVASFLALNSPWFRTLTKSPSNPSWRTFSIWWTVPAVILEITHAAS